MAKPWVVCPSRSPSSSTSATSRARSSASPEATRSASPNCRSAAASNFALPVGFMKSNAVDWSKSPGDLPRGNFWLCYPDRSARRDGTPNQFSSAGIARRKKYPVPRTFRTDNLFPHHVAHPIVSLPDAVSGHSAGRRRLCHRALCPPGQHRGRLRDEQLPEFHRRIGDESGPVGNGPGGVVGGARIAPRRQKQTGGISETFY